jgi:hypothetical protein
MFASGRVLMLAVAVILCGYGFVADSTESVADEKEPFERLTAEAHDFPIFGGGMYLYCFCGGQIELEDGEEIVRRILLVSGAVPEKGQFKLDGFDTDYSDLELDIKSDFPLDLEVDEEPKEAYVTFVTRKGVNLKVREISVVERTADRLVFSVDADIDATKLFDVLKLLAKTHFGDKTLVVEAVAMKKDRYAVRLSEGG